MAQRNADTRIRYTKAILRKSLLELMETSPIGSITISAICRRAETNRGTFYKRYADPFDLLAEIQDELFASIQRSLAGKRDGKAGSALEKTFEAIAEDRDAYRVVLGENGDKGFLARIMNIAFAESANSLKAKYGIERARARLVYVYASAGVAGVVRHWLSEAPRIDPREIAELVESMIVGGLEGLARGFSPARLH